jgi:hypothetical protein
MSFLYPQFLWALTLLAIPILVHLFNFRRYKRILFSNVAFLQNISEETKSRNKIKHLLILLTRLLALALIVLAFAYPYPTNKSIITKEAENKTVIYVDNSYSMTLEDKDGVLLEQAKNFAVELIGNADESAQFRIATPNVNYSSFRWLSKKEALDAISFIKPTSQDIDFKKVLLRIEDAIDKETQQNLKAYIISDFQKHQYEDILKTKTHSKLNLNLIALQPKAINNLAIDSLFSDEVFFQKNKISNITAVIKNYGSEKLENVSSVLEINGENKGIISFDINPNEVKEVPFAFQISDTGINKGSITITDFPVEFDNKVYFNFEVKKEIRILLVDCNSTKSNSILKRIYNQDEIFKIEEVKQSNIILSDLKNYNTIILSEISTIDNVFSTSLQSFIKEGGNVIIIPSDKANIEELNRLTSIAEYKYKELQKENIGISSKSLDNALFNGVFGKKDKELIAMPILKKYYNSYEGITNRILYTDNKKSHVNSFTDNGTIFIFSAPIADSASNLSSHALIVPLFINMAKYKIGNSDLNSNKKEYYSINSNGINNNIIKSLKIQKDSIVYQPDFKSNNNSINIYTEQLDLEPNNYEVYANNNDSLLGVISANNSNYESSPDYLAIDELKTLKNINTTSIENRNFKAAIVKEESKWWIWFVILGVFLLLMESILIRFAKV